MSHQSVSRQIAKEVGGKASEILRLPFSALYFDPSKDAPGRGESSKSHVENLANLIREQGFLPDFPIKARPDRSESKFEIVNGRNRYRAMELIVKSNDLGNWDGYAYVTATKPDINESEFYFLTLLGNSDTQKPFTAAEEGFYFKRLYDDGRTYDEIAKRIQKSITYVSDRINLVNMPSALQKEMNDFVAKGIMSPTAVTELAKMPEKDREEAWKDIKNQHAEKMNGKPAVTPNGKTSTKNVIKVKDVKSAAKKGAISHIQIGIFKQNLAVCKKMESITESAHWGQAVKVLEAILNGEVIES